MMKEETIKEKKKQKAPLGIRPSDYVEQKFKSMADDKGISQTKIIWKKYFGILQKNSNEALKLQSLDCSLELQSISGASSTLIKAIDKIVTKAQLEIMSKK